MNARTNNTIYTIDANGEVEGESLFDHIGNALEWAADRIEDAAVIATEGLIAAEARTEVFVSAMWDSAPAIRNHAKAKAEARMAARLAKYSK